MAQQAIDLTQAVIDSLPVLKTTADTPILTLRVINTPLGYALAAVDDGVYLLEFIEKQRLQLQLGDLQKRLRCGFVWQTHDLLDTLEKQLTEYFARQRKVFDLPIQFIGTAFQTRVWQALRTIPYGETLTYGEQARLIDNPRAVRAVGAANGKNKISILVPCHRVVGAKGGLVGYAGGLSRKQALLDIESTS